MFVRFALGTNMLGKKKMKKKSWPRFLKKLRNVGLHFRPTLGLQMNEHLEILATYCMTKLKGKANWNNKFRLHRQWTVIYNSNLYQHLVTLSLCES